MSVFSKFKNIMGVDGEDEDYDDDDMEFINNTRSSYIPTDDFDSSAEQPSATKRNKVVNINISASIQTKIS